MTGVTGVVVGTKGDVLSLGAVVGVVGDVLSLGAVVDIAGDVLSLDVAGGGLSATIGAAAFADKE